MAFRFSNITKALQEREAVKSVKTPTLVDSPQAANPELPWKPYLALQNPYEAFTLVPGEMVNLGESSYKKPDTYSVNQEYFDWINANKGTAPVAGASWVEARGSVGDENSVNPGSNPAQQNTSGGFWVEPDPDGNGWGSQFTSGVSDFLKSPVALPILAMATAGIAGIGAGAGAGSAGAAGAESLAGLESLLAPSAESWGATLADSLGGSFLPTAAADAGLTAAMTPELTALLQTIPEFGMPAAAASSAAIPAVFNAAADSQAASTALGITGSQAAASAVAPSAVNLVNAGGVMSTAAPGLLSTVGSFLKDNPTLSNFLGNAGLAAGSGLLQSILGPDAPPQLDYNALLQQQSQLSQNDALFNANLNRVDTTTPWGSQTWGKVADPTAPGGYRYTQNISLAPDQQSLLDKTTQGQLQQADLLSGAVSRAGNAIGQPLDFSGMPSLVGGLSAPQLAMSSGLPALQDFYANTPGTLGEGGVGALQSAIQKALAGVGSPTQFNQEASDAVYNQASRYYDVQSGQDKSALEARLAEQGFVPGTPAYNQAMGNFMNSRNLALADMRDRATTQGFSVGNQQFNNSVTGANQQIAGATTGFNAGLSANSQNFSQAQTNQQLLLSALQQRNSNAQQNWSNNLAQTQSNNTTAGNQFNMQQQAGQFQNQARTQGISEALLQRQTPLNELSAIRTGTQVAAPSFQTAPQSSVSTPSVSGFAQTGYNTNLAAYNAATGQANQMYGSLTNLGSLLNSGTNSNWLSNLINGLAGTKGP